MAVLGVGARIVVGAIIPNVVSGGSKKKNKEVIENTKEGASSKEAKSKIAKSTKELSSKLLLT